MEAAGGIALIRFGARFDVAEAQRACESIAAFAPLTSLVLDFGAVRDFSDAALFPLARALATAAAPRIVVRGVTRHEDRLLRHCGFVAGFVAPSDGTAVTAT